MKIISKEQIFKNCKWLNPNVIVFELVSDMLNKKFVVGLNFNPKEEKKEIHKKTIESIIEFQNLKTLEIHKIYDAMWKFVRKWKTQADLKHMGISTIEEAIAKTQISGIDFINEEILDHTFFNIYLSVEWDIEHGITISYYNGVLDDVQ